MDAQTTRVSRERSAHTGPNNAEARLACRVKVLLPHHMTEYGTLKITRQLDASAALPP